MISDREKVTESGGVLFMRFIVTYNICVSFLAAFYNTEAVKLSTTPHIISELCPPTRRTASAMAVIPILH